MSQATLNGLSSRRAGWNKVVDPTTGWLSSKTSGWTADSFSGGLTVDFSSVVPEGTRAVRAIVLVEGGTLGSAWARAAGDSSVSNTPASSAEAAQYVGTLVNVSAGFRNQVVLDLSTGAAVEFAVQNTAIDIYVSYPIAYLL